MVQRRGEHVGHVGGHAVVDDPQVDLLLGEVDLEQRVELEQDPPERERPAEAGRPASTCSVSFANSATRRRISTCSRRIGDIEWRFWNIRSSSG